MVLANNDLAGDLLGVASACRARQEQCRDCSMADFPAA
jgi:hypothetical protein